MAMAGESKNLNKLKEKFCAWQQVNSGFLTCECNLSL